MVVESSFIGPIGQYQELLDHEADLVEEMIGTTIDPEELKLLECPREALLTIATNTCNVVCAKLNRLYQKS